MKNLSFREIPASVYRIQLHAEFTFKQAIKILPYLKEFGFEGVYCSPFFKSFSNHGYDVTDPNTINPKIGTVEEYKEFCEELKRLELKQIADIVPNHMGIQGGENHWWQDVLENGPFSEYACFFDINWSPEKKELQDRVLLPILKAPYDDALENQEIQLIYGEGAFTLQYAQYPLPVAGSAYAIIFENELDQLQEKYGISDTLYAQYQELIELYRFFPVAFQERTQKKEEGKRKLLSLLKGSQGLREHIARQVELFNGEKGEKSSFDLLDKLLEAQFYRLSYWKVAKHEINYRRFFNIPELVSIRIEEDKVLESHHRLLFELISEGHIQGLRVDHPDGLYDPAGYFARLREKFFVYTVAEKILEGSEKLSGGWEIEGTVGYDYLNVLSGIFVKQANEKALTDIYEEFIGKKTHFEEILYQSKKYFTDYLMVSEVETLGLRLDRLSENRREYRDFTRHELTQALAEVIASFPVYRTYIGPVNEPTQQDIHSVKIAIEKAKKRATDLDVSIFAFIEKVLLVKLEDEGENFREFALRFQQITAPIMAKGLEDTALYIYNRLLSLNEVGGDPRRFGHSIGDFHTYNLEKKQTYPFGFVASSTHDTKRSEDVRMRLHVLSEMPEKWELEIKKWALVNHKYHQGRISPNTEYFIYQTLLGVWPSKSIKKEKYPLFCERLWQVILKSLRESKQETNWEFPNEEYEEEVRVFFFSILSKVKSNHFFKLFTDFHKVIDRYGALNSLSQVVLKIASPGVVDIFQGNEMLTYRLVDPDNRFPVDFDTRKKMLSHLKRTQANLLFAAHELSELKFFVQSKALHFRRENKEIMLEGDYIPLTTKGKKQEHVIAFMRKRGEQAVIVLAGRFFSELADASWDLPLGQHAWNDTEVILPSDLKKSVFTDVFTGQIVTPKKRGSISTISIAQAFEQLPICYLVMTD